MNKFIIIGPTRICPGGEPLDHIARYAPVNISNDPYRSNLQIQYAISIWDVAGKQLKLECDTWEDCEFILKKLDSMLQPLEIRLPEKKDNNGKIL